MVTALKSVVQSLQAVVEALSGAMQASGGGPQSAGTGNGAVGGAGDGANSCGNIPSASMGGGGVKQVAQMTMPTYAGGGSLGPQANVNDKSVRNPAQAQRTIQRLQAATQHLQTPEQARAAGYKPNPSSPDHWINDNIFATRDGYNLERPATIMYENGRLVGVMLSHDPQRGAPPDLGAGTWHTHGGTAAREYAAHVWFNKPIQSAFDQATGDV
jgi:hypothetical protein